MNRAQIDGRELEYEVRGAGEPVVLVHGSHITDAFAPLLGEPVLTDRHRLILYHRRGFAGSTHPDGPLSIAPQAADCRALMRHLGVHCAHILGHSYGGAIALQLALDAPEAVHSLALLEPALLMVPSAQQFMEAMGPLLQMYEAGNKTGAVDGFLQAVVGPEYRSVLDRVLPGAFAQAVADADTFFRIELPALQQWRFTPAAAGRITQPVLSVLGADSHTLWPGWVEVHHLVQTWLPQAETFVLEGATHGLQIIDPKGMAEGLADFFARHPLPGRP
ncbi:MAG TPA: alpha/beta hydrolase [Alphaproteobacteria bacterium]|nr:alpha/beta hydrolase [Alphaproteobacteria bacterium]